MAEPKLGNRYVQIDVRKGHQCCYLYAHLAPTKRVIVIFSSATGVVCTTALEERRISQKAQTTKALLGSLNTSENAERDVSYFDQFC